MYEVVKMKDLLIMDSLRLAAEIESQATYISKSSSKLLNSNDLFYNAFQIYRAIAENESYENKWRGEAAYRMWRLLNQDYVPIQLQQGETKHEKIKEILLFSANLGYEEAQLQLQENRTVKRFDVSFAKKNDPLKPF